MLLFHLSSKLHLNLSCRFVPTETWLLFLLSFFLPNYLCSTCPQAPIWLVLHSWLMGNHYMFIYGWLLLCFGFRNGSFINCMFTAIFVQAHSFTVLSSKGVIAWWEGVALMLVLPLIFSFCCFFNLSMFGFIASLEVDCCRS